MAQSDLDRATRNAMLTLLAGHFDGVEREIFEADLAGKDHVILLEDDEGALRGFSTLHVYASGAAGAPVTVIYSGDTIVCRDVWGSPVLPRTWIRSAAQLTGGASGTREVYWLLLTSGFRTYRFLPVFYRRFHPRFDEATPPAERHLIDAIAAERFGSSYDPTRGIVHFPRPQVLKRELLDVPSGRSRDPHIAFFLQANPGFVHGDELVCLTRVHEENLTPAGRRMLR